jgi:hypothetical protein
VDGSGIKNFVSENKDRGGGWGYLLAPAQVKNGRHNRMTPKRNKPNPKQGKQGKTTKKVLFPVDGWLQGIK